MAPSWISPKVPRVFTLVSTRFRSPTPVARLCISPSPRCTASSRSLTSLNDSPSRRSSVPCSFSSTVWRIWSSLRSLPSCSSFSWPVTPWSVSASASWLSPKRLATSSRSSAAARRASSRPWRSSSRLWRSSSRTSRNTATAPAPATTANRSQGSTSPTTTGFYRARWCTLVALGRLLHRSSRLRVGARDPDHLRRGRLHSVPARRPVPGDHPADRPGHRLVSRRQRGGGREQRHRAARAADQRRRGHAVHVVEQRQRRQLHDHGHLRGRLQPEHRRRRRAEPGRGRHPPAPRGGPAHGRHRAPRVDRPDDRGEPDLAGRLARRRVPVELRGDQHRRPAEAADRRGRHQPCSASGATRCASGSTRTSWPRSPSRRRR